ncbi:CAP domain-containing protein [bacterium]|nr:CAP domain-containing protein [bacterium]
MQTLLRVFGLVFCLGLVSAIMPARYDVGSTKELLELEEHTLDLVNKYRSKKGLNELKSIQYMQDLAREHSLKMAQGVRAFGHRGWDERADLIFENIEVEMVAENVAFNKGYDDPAERAFDGWLHSSTHKENILNEDFDITGVGISKSEDGTIYFTQIFASYLE